MFKEGIERAYSTYHVSFGMYKGKHIEDIPDDWMVWWLNKREKDDEHGPDIEWDHKIAAERIYNFERTYLILIFTLYKRHRIKHTVCYSDRYQLMSEKFWEAIDENKSLINDNNKLFIRDEIEAFMWASWAESKNISF